MAAGGTTLPGPERAAGEPLWGIQQEYMQRFDVDWAAVQVDYAAGELTLPMLARKHGVGQSTIQKRARREGWPREGRARRIAERIAAGSDGPPEWRTRRRARKADPLRPTLARMHRLVRRLIRALEQHVAEEAAGAGNPGARAATAQTLSVLTRALAVLARVDRENRRMPQEEEPGSMGQEAAWAELESRISRLHEHEEAERRAAEPEAERWLAAQMTPEAPRRPGPGITAL